MSFADAWFHDDEKVAGSQTKKDNEKVVKRSHLKGLIGQQTAPLARPSGYESRKLLQKKMQEKAKKDEEKKKNKKTLRQTILLQQQGKSTRE